MIDPDIELINKSLGGDSRALEELINNYKDIIFNYSLRMVGDYHLAQDISQEVLIKVVTKLSTFKNKSTLKTWVLNIANNQIISQKRKKRELIFSDFKSHNKFLLSLEDQVEYKGLNPEQETIVDEMKNQCVEGMLLCLSRDQRSAFILGAVMGLKSSQGAEALDISEDAFRKRLSRARKDLSQYMNNHCGLVNKESSCRCFKKAKSAFDAGYLKEDKAIFSKKRKNSLSNYANSLMDNISKIYREVPIMEMDATYIQKIIEF